MLGVEKSPQGYDLHVDTAIYSMANNEGPIVNWFYNKRGWLLNCVKNEYFWKYLESTVYNSSYIVFVYEADLSED